MWLTLVLLALAITIGIHGITQFKELYMIANDAKNAIGVDNYIEFSDKETEGISVYGIFNLSTDNPVSNNEYGIPNCLYGKVTNITSSSSYKHHRYKITTIWEDKCEIVNIDNNAINYKLLIDKFYKLPTVKGCINSNIHYSYMPMNRNYFILYSPTLDVYCLSFDTNKSINDLFSGFNYYEDSAFSIIISSLSILLAIIIIMFASRSK